MKDKNDTELQEGCKLRSELFGKDTTEIIYEGGIAFAYPGSGGGYMYHDQESLLRSHWVVVETPSKDKKKDKEDK